MNHRRFPGAGPNAPARSLAQRGLGRGKVRTWVLVCIGLGCWNVGLLECGGSADRVGWVLNPCVPCAAVGDARALRTDATITASLSFLALGRTADEVEGLDSLERRGPDPIDQMRQTWQEWGKAFVWTAAGLLLLAALRIVNPFRLYDAAGERLLKRSLRGVDDLLKRIQQEAEAATENVPKEETVIEEGLLAGLAEVAEFTNAEQVPSYVLTVNDLMLDNIRVTLKRLRRFTEGNAQRYRDYMFSVLKGMKTLTEQSAEAGVASGLAVDLREYFADDRRYQAWSKLLGHAARRGRHQEVAQEFLRFMRDLRARPQGRGAPDAPQGEDEKARTGPSRSASSPSDRLTISPSVPAAVPAPRDNAEIPTFVNEETLPTLQRAAAREARNFTSLVRTGKSPDGAYAWQFDLVRRQQQGHLRPEAQRMLAIFLSHETKSLRQITKIRMLPCRTWEHVLYLLGGQDDAQLHRRVEDGWLTVQEIVILEKTFLQTFAKRESLGHVYGRDTEAALMMDLHLPQIRREALALLRRLRQTEPEPLDDATQALNEEETPQNGQVKRLIEHYVHHRHDPPG
jgi:hypothetical protein